MAKRVYFAFDYEDVSDFRANVVRNHNFVGGVEKAGYLDASMWEEAKKKDPASLKKLIDAELESTSATAILIGSDTWARRWVRYEIFKSIQRGNRVLGVHINSIADRDSKTKPQGTNPFDYLALSISDDGKSATPTEWNGASWVRSADADTYQLKTEWPVDGRGKILQVSGWLRTYDWVANDGYNNFTKWIE